MTSAENSVTREGMLAASQRMGQSVQTVNNIARDVQASVTSLGSTFTGGAADANVVAYREWQRCADEVVRQLNDMMRIMNEGAEHVGRSDADTTDAVTAGARRMSGAYSTGGLTGL